LAWFEFELRVVCVVARTETIELFTEEDSKTARRTRTAENEGIAGEADADVGADNMVEKQ